jgi:2-polyprenyl-3-methyl-5-hydroxy-6-metoxy-1,4-benzoquinol methylase
MKKIFDNYVETSFVGNHQNSSKFQQFELNYKKFFPPYEGSNVLDIGIGRGEMLSKMNEWGYKYNGIDISPSTVEFCNQLNLKCELVENTEDWLMKNQKSFDVITCFDVVEHVPRESVILFLESIRLALKDNGKAIIQVPNLQSPFGYLHHFNDFTHVSGFVEHSLRQVLLTAGFNQIEFFGFEEFTQNNFKYLVKKGIRSIFRKLVRFLRWANNNPNPKILDPVMYAVVS